MKRGNQIVAISLGITFWIQVRYRPIASLFIVPTFYSPKIDNIDTLYSNVYSFSMTSNPHFQLPVVL